jgi:P-type Ca2+ transporter type 2C
MTGAAEIAVQVVIVFIGGTAFQVTRIGGREWGISLVLGFVSIPLGALIRLLPNRPFESLFILMRLLPKPDGGLPQVRPDGVEWSSGGQPKHIISSIGAGWTPQSRGTLPDLARYDPSKSSAAL